MSDEREDIEKSLKFYKDRLSKLQANLHAHILSAYHTQEQADECREKIKRDEFELDSLFPYEKDTK